ncbi:extracellular solute-binding protein [Hoeflea sp. WL0058]|uniref:Extracellular solute-binding protein n=1 Tax=Flavimaribacter sediminis TaxID=2865987 RepID=A0AAE2ZPU8_9HYPH|nr:extracellular solute-binding protein [Flavimaribacter sediminis]MBW8638547.1 extracellular solute-binding protein [Flavimaribacter sediminis]
MTQTFRPLATILCLAFALAGAGGDAVASDFVVTSWGGSYELSQQKAYGESFEDQTGEAVVWEEYHGGLDQLRAQVESGNVVWDVIDVFAHDARSGCEEGLFETLPDSFYNRARMNDLIVERPNNCVGANILWSWIYAYDERRFPDGAPQTIADFFDLEKFPGKRALSVYPQANLEMALVADGVAPGVVYEVLDTAEGVDRAFRKLSELQGNIVFWSAGEEPLEMMRSGEVVMATAYSGRVASAALGDENWMKAVFDGQVVEEEWFVIARGTQKLELAKAFLAHVAQPMQQALQARWIAYGPMRFEALEIIENGEPWFHTGEPVLPYLPTTTARLNRSVISDPDWWARNNKAITERFAAWRRALQL